MSSGAATDINIIDQLGVQAVAEPLSISPQAVSKWKQRGVIPQARRNQLRSLATANGLAEAAQVESNATSMVESVKRFPMVFRRLGRSSMRDTWTAHVTSTAET